MRADETEALRSDIADYASSPVSMERFYADRVVFRFFWEGGRCASMAASDELDRAFVSVRLDDGDAARKRALLDELACAAVLRMPLLVGLPEAAGGLMPALEVMHRLEMVHREYRTYEGNRTKMLFTWPGRLSRRGRSILTRTLGREV